MTGTRDGSPIGNTAVEDQLAVYPALPRGERASRRNPNHQKAILALSTAFWDAFPRGDAAALPWLRSDAARWVLEPEDRWRWK